MYKRQVYVRIKEGTVKPGDRIRMMATGAEFDVVEVGVMHPAGLVPNKGLAAGDVGYIAASIKNIQMCIRDRYSPAKRQKTLISSQEYLQRTV